MTRIVFIITGLWTGGAEMMLLKMLQRLDKRFTPHVVSLTTLGEIGPRIQSLGIPVESLGMRPSLPNPLTFFKLVRRLQAMNPEIVHTWMYHADLIGGLAARLAGVKAIGWGIRNSFMARSNLKFSTRLVVATCAQMSHWLPDLILICSEAARCAHVEAGYANDRIVVIPNGFDLNRFKPDPQARKNVRVELGLDEDTPLVGMIGRFDPQKNHAGFFEAAGMLHQHMPEVHFVLAGKNVIQGNPEMATAIDKAGVRQVTHLLGPRSDMPRLMTSLDVLASSSTGEAFPNVLGEAMACGVPCVVTDVGDSAQIVGDTGRVVLSGNMAGLAQDLQSLLTLPADDRRALGEKARARIRDNFEIGLIIAHYAQFYEELAAIGRSKA
jgi:glycosyltransferase involved in cell wall biosynthesis